MRSGAVWALLAGKGVSAAMGVALLLALLSQLAPAVYGIHAMGWAAIELLYLLTGAGLSTLAQREVPLWHLRWQARPAGASLRRRLLRVGALRVSWMALGLGLVWLLVLLPAGSFGLDAPTLLAWSVWAVAGAASRYAEELLAGLSEAAMAQALAAAGQALRLLALFALPWLPAAGSAHPLDLARWWAVEAAVAAVLSGAAAGWMAWRLRIPAETAGAADGAPADGSPAGTTGPAARAEPRPDEAALSRLRRSFWLVQILGLALGPAALRLWAGLWSGPTAAGLLGAGLSLLEMLRNALPLTWLAPWLRPQLVQRHEAGAPVAALWAPVARALLLSVAVALPVLAVLALLATGPDGAASAAPAPASALGTLTTGDALPAALRAWLQALHGAVAAPGAWVLLLGAGLLLQVAHLGLGLLTVTLGLARPHLAATALAGAVVAAAGGLAPVAGLWTWPLATVLAESLWLAVVGVALWRLAAAGRVPAPASRLDHARRMSCGST